LKTQTGGQAHSRASRTKNSAAKELGKKTEAEKQQLVPAPQRQKTAGAPAPQACEPEQEMSREKPPVLGLAELKERNKKNQLP
jgi:hypothetical protein